MHHLLKHKQTDDSATINNKKTYTTMTDSKNSFFFYDPSSHSCGVQHLILATSEQAFIKTLATFYKTRYPTATPAKTTTELLELLQPGIAYPESPVGTADAVALPELERVEADA